MEKIDFFKNVQIADKSSPILTIACLLLTIMCSYILKYVYENKSNSLSSKYQLSNIIPILSSTTFLVILIVKSSLALSLGLVGALSIVRFRTPIKEPEELIYLFLSIAIGLGCAANYVLVTTLVTLATLTFIYFFLSEKKVIKGTSEYSLMINWTKNDISLNKILNIFDSNGSSITLLRFTVNPDSNSAIFLIESNKKDSIDNIVSEIKSLDSNSTITLTPPNQSW